MAKELSALRKQWQITKTRWQVTWFWRVFGINAMQKKWTKLLVLACRLWSGLSLCQPRSWK